MGSEEGEAIAGDESLRFVIPREAWPWSKRKPRLTVAMASSGSITQTILLLPAFAPIDRKTTSVDPDLGIFHLLSQLLAKPRKGKSK